MDWGAQSETVAFYKSIGRRKIIGRNPDGIIIPTTEDEHQTQISETAEKQLMEEGIFDSSTQTTNRCVGGYCLGESGVTTGGLITSASKQRLFVGAAGVDDYDEYYDAEAYNDESYEPTADQPPEEKKKDDKSDKKGHKGSKNEVQKRKNGSGSHNDEEGDKKNCLTRLLFSKCWSGNQGKNSKGKPRRGKKGCPLYNTCPCGDKAPCAKIEKKPCPASEKKGSGGKGKSGEGKNSGSKRDNGKCAKKKKQDNTLSALCGKFCKAPCIFSRNNGEHGEGKSGWRCGACNRKKHVHTPCCCRCTDNPPLPKEKGSTSKDSTPSGNKPHHKKSASPQAGSLGSGGEYYEAEDQDDRSVHSAIIQTGKEGKDPTQEPLRCVGCTDCDEIRSSGHSKKGSIQGIKNKAKPNLAKAKKKEGAEEYKTKTVVLSKSSTNLREEKPNLTKALKKENAKESKGKMEILSTSSTNMQVLLPPSISSESTEHNMVSHRILKTLSTIHGPIRVEQKIVVKGSKNAYVIVTHGSACECNICTTLKKDNITHKASPEVVRLPTDNGCDTLVNHAEDCQCPLCSVLEQGITDDTPSMDMEKYPPSVVWASWSKDNLRASDHRYSESVTQDSRTTADETKVCGLRECSNCEGQNRGGTKKHYYKNREEKSKKKKCYCSKCVKRRKVKRLKKKLKHVLEPSDLSEVFRELSHHGFTVEQDPEGEVNQNRDEDYEENMRRESRTSNKKVSFSGDTKRMGSADSKDTVILADSRYTNTKEVIPTIKADENEQRRKADNSKGVLSKCPQKGEIKSLVYNKAASPHSNKTATDEPCHGAACNGPYSDSISRVTRTTKSKVPHYRPSRDEKQNCFPEKSGAQLKCGCRKNKADSDQVREKILDEVTHPDDDFIRPPTRCEPGCMGRCRFLTPRDEVSRLATEHFTPVVQASREKLPHKILYWIPSSPNLAAAFSSDSYYIPDIDEFPTSDRGSTSKEQSTPCSSQRYQCQKNPHPQPGSACGTRRDRTQKHVDH